jgi:ABC-type branched-subunit amino acid transport system substrate-binding protein
MTKLVSRTSAHVLALMLSASLIVLLVGCGRSSGRAAAPSSAPSQSGTGTGSASGVFGDLGRICEPGKPSGSAGVRGVTASTIRIGTLADPGNSVLPGLEQEFFDAADAFSTWCNAAGGINGRKIVVDKRDAKLFNGGQQIVNSCQSDFMLVGGGNGIDAPDVKPRLGCKLGQIPAYSVSTEAVKAPLQVTPAPSVPTEYEAGPLRLLALAYPGSQKGLGVGGSNVASTTPQGEKAAQAWTQLGYKVTALQNRPPLIDNFRPYIEQLKGAGATAFAEVTGTSAAPEITAMNDVGWKPFWINFNIVFYSSKTVDAAKTISFPPSFVGLPTIPFELADQFPAVQQVKTQLSAVTSKPQFDNFTSLAYMAWTLWAESASECGNNLTQECVLDKAGSFANWTGGGISSPVSTISGQQRSNPCVAMMRLTPTGWVYDRALTKPNNGIFNCDPKNTAKVSAFGT